MPDTLTITNDGPDIVTANYWQTAMARAGKFYVSTNAGCFRLLVPALHLGSLRDMRAAHTCVVSRGPYPDMRLPGAIDRMPLDQDTLQPWVLSVWAHRVGQTATKALEKPCHYRRVR